LTMNLILFYLAWALYGAAILAGPTHTTRLIYPNNEAEAPKRWWSKIIFVIVMYPVMGYILWGFGWAMMWIGKIMATPVKNFLWNVYN
jgi:hypothetical protein